jgi:hypothetical protein
MISGRTWALGESVHLRHWEVDVPRPTIREGDEWKDLFFQSTGCARISADWLPSLT